ncbi:MAG: glycoside hydrolase family 2 protein, partial [Candidatus Hodarchaeota archaeon]
MVERILLSNDSWFLAPDVKNSGIKDPYWYESSWFKKKSKKLIRVTVPNSWQTLEGLEKYEGVCWYFTRMKTEILKIYLDSKKKLYLKFNGANYLVDAWCNGIHLGRNEGGYLPFSFQLKKETLASILEKDNEEVILSVRVDNTRRHDQIPEFSCDWFQWGGIYRDVYLEVQPEKGINGCYITPILRFSKTGLLESASIDLDIKGFKGLNVKWKVTEEDGREISAGTAELGTSKDQDPNGMSSAKESIEIKEPKLWDLDNPYRYNLLLQDENNDVLYESRFGLREIKVEGTSILLNGKSIKFKGSSLHEEKYPAGREYSRDERKEDLLDMKSLGFNFLRTAHYSHNESLMDAADEVGMLIGEEIPVYWDIDYKNKKTQKLAVKMLKTLIDRDYNHPSVAWWSVGNEIPVQKRDCQLFIKMLLRYVKKRDKSRICCYVSKNFIADPIRKHSDILAFNGYLGWYYFSERMWSFAIELIHGSQKEKPLVVTEFGAGAKLGFGRYKKVNEKFSEWKQASILSQAIRSFNSKPFVAGWLIWIYRDFKSHMRLNKYQEGYNRKGIVDENGSKKIAGVWMPKLSRQRHSYSKIATIGALFLAKVLKP